jgi:hypothetical protein
MLMTRLHRAHKLIAKVFRRQPRPRMNMRPTQPHPLKRINLPQQLRNI